jgi:hypothetical protein
MCLLPDCYWLVVRIAVQTTILLENTFQGPNPGLHDDTYFQKTSSKHSKVSFHMQMCPEIFGSRSLEVLSGGLIEWLVDVTIKHSHHLFQNLHNYSPPGPPTTS